MRGLRYRHESTDEKCNFVRSNFYHPSSSRLLLWPDKRASFRHISCWRGRGDVPDTGLHRIIRDCPFACECIWQFGYSHFLGGPFCRHGPARTKQHLTCFVNELISCSPPQLVSAASFWPSLSCCSKRDSLPPRLPSFGVGWWDLNGWRLKGNYRNAFTLGPSLSD